MRVLTLFSTFFLQFLFSRIVFAQTNCPAEIYRPLWPLPTDFSCGSASVQIDATSFVIRSTGIDSLVLERAIARYEGIIFGQKKSRGHPVHIQKPRKFTSALNIDVLTDDLDLQLETDESYTLVVPDDGSDATLVANTVFGAIWGLETFSQLILPGYVITGAPWQIVDVPRFPHRGILLDTSRNFYPIEDLKRTIEALSYNKMNMLHWHIVDKQSFPIESQYEPRLAEFGAYSPEEVYSTQEVQELVEFARDHGVRIMPEFDTPGHTHSWGLFNRTLLACPDALGYTDSCGQPPCGQLDPSVPEIYTLVEGVFAEMAVLFPENLFHIGADEINYNCWAESDTIEQWMIDNGFGDFDDVLQYFEDFSHEFLKTIGKRPVNWEEAFFDIELPPQSVVHVWIGGESMVEVIRAGHYGIMSNSEAWYLDCGFGNWHTLGGNSWCDPYKTWQVMYLNEPLDGIPPELREQAEELVLGGESAMWSENTDPTILDPKVWPRSCAVAERLWSREDVNDIVEAAPRLLTHRQRMVDRGIDASPIQPKWCLINEDGLCTGEERRHDKEITPLRDLLTKLQMSEYAEAFEQQKVLFGDICYILPEEIEKIVPHVGPQSRLRKYCKEYVW